MTTPLSRRGFTHPAQGAAGDATLYSQIETLYKTIGDDLATRWLRATAVTNTSTVTLTHGFRIPFANFKYAVYSGSTSNDDGTTDYTKITSGITVVANGTNPTTQIDVTNATGGTIANLRVLIWCERGQLSDNSDIDFSTSPQDGQALVYNASTGKWLPGASGDASFKLQSITSDVLTLKGGHLVLGDDRELATFDGGSTYGGDITVNLLTLLASPANGQTYYLYIDLDTLGAAVLDESVNREIYGITVSNLVLSTSVPRNMNRARYRAIGLVVGIAASHYSTTAFKTLGVRFSNNGPAAVSPIVSRPASGSAVGTVGSAGQIAAGHLLSTKSYPSSLTAANVAFYGLAGLTDGSGNARTLTNNGTSVFTANGILGGSNAAMTLNGTSQYLSSTDALFNPGVSTAFSIALWVKPANVTGTKTIAATARSAGGSAQNFIINQVGSSLVVIDNLSSTATFTVPNAFSSGTWAHVVMRYDGASTAYLYVNGKLVGTTPFTNGSVGSNQFDVGALTSNGSTSQFFAGDVDELFFAQGTLTDADVRRLAAYRYDHNAAVSAVNQRWSGKVYPNGGEPAGQLSMDGWVVSASDTNSVFWDFSDLAAADTVDVYLEDMGLSPNVVSTVPPFDTTYTSTPPGTVAHGQPDIPDVVLLVETGTAGQWDQIPSEGKIQVDATNMTIDLSALNPAVGVSPNRVRIIARPSRLATVGVPDANTSRTGSVTASGHQNFAGLKGFLDGSYSVGNIRGSEGAGTTTLTDDLKRHQIFALTAARTVVLPTTSIKAGDEWVLENTGAFDLTVQASNASALTIGNGTNQDASIQKGRVVLRALQDTPTTPAHWRVVNVYEDWSGLVALTGGVTTNPTATAIVTRNNRIVTMFYPSTQATSNATTNVALLMTGAANQLPARFGPATGMLVSGSFTGVDSGVVAAEYSIAINPSNVTLSKNLNGSTNSFTASGSKGFYDTFVNWMLF